MSDRPTCHDDAPLTELLQRSADGDDLARERVWAQVHDQLRALARSRLAREAPVTCQPTELVHEAFLKLAGATPTPRDRNHFLALAAVAMRQVLVDQARSRNRQKRGGGARPLTLDSRAVGAPTTGRGIDVLDLHEAIDALAGIDARKAELVEMRSGERGKQRLVFHAPTRALIGYHGTIFLVLPHSKLAACRTTNMLYS